MTYKDYVEAVGRLILKGIWLSDAIEITIVVQGQSRIPVDTYRKLHDEQFITDVDVFVDATGQRAMMPKYKTLF